MTTGWARVGEAVRAARAAQNLTQDELAERVGVSNGTIRAIERGTEFGKVTSTLRQIERILGWGHGSIEAIQAGGDPLPGKPTAETKPAAGEMNTRAVTDGLPWRVADALVEGTTLDARVRSLGPNTEMVVIIKGKSGAAPEDLRAELLAWEKREGHLERLGEVPDESSET